MLRLHVKHSQRKEREKDMYNKFFGMNCALKVNEGGLTIHTVAGGGG